MHLIAGLIVCRKQACTANDNLLIMVRILPGSVRGVKSLALSVYESGIENKTLILDRVFILRAPLKP